MPQRLKTDWILFSTVTALVFFGVVIRYSASSVMANLNPKFGSSYYFVLRQVVWMLLAIPVMMFLKRTHYRKLQNPAVAFSGFGVVLILLLAVYFIDRDQHRWL